tara:strand:+ start:2131 stop:2643 length:513 start_codon:yes stop_codon:yes gene_type:complete
MIGNDYSILGKYGNGEIVKAKLSHAEYLQHHLRETDRRECLIANCTPWRALLYPLKSKSAETYTTLIDDVPAMMFGVVPIDQYNVGRIWMLCSDQVEEHQKSFVKFSYNIVEYFQNKYYLLENIVPVEHTKTIKWLEYLGFFIHRKPFLINEYKVYRFVRCQSESVEIIV